MVSLHESLFRRSLGVIRLLPLDAAADAVILGLLVLLFQRQSRSLGGDGERIELRHLVGVFEGIPFEAGPQGSRSLGS